MERLCPTDGETAQRVAVKDETHKAAPARFILKVDAAEMFLDDLLDDGEAEAGALGAGGHIGFGQALALGRKADAGIGDLDRQARALLADAHGDLAAFPAPGFSFVIFLLDRLDSVL